MQPRILAPMALCLLLAVFGLHHVMAEDVALQAPVIEGEWAGIWGAYIPELGKALDEKRCLPMSCTVVKEGDAWTATFKGDAGGAYQYTIKMPGRQVGDTVLFSGTVDLGERSGGVYDWIGRAQGEVFVGFYTSARHTGVFRLTRES